MFPRLGEGNTASAAADADQAASSAPGEDEVLLRIRQRRSGAHQDSFEVFAAPDGNTEIPLAVCATTTGSRVPRAALQQSPWLTRCVSGPEGATVVCPLACDDPGEEEEMGALMGGDDRQSATPDAAVFCTKVSEAVLEIGVPSRGAGQNLLNPRGLFECLDLCGQGAGGLTTTSLDIAHLLALFLWAAVLELHDLVGVFREAVAQRVGIDAVSLVLAASHAAADKELMRDCYWCLREAICGVAGVPISWLDGRSTVKLVRGVLWHVGMCKTPMRALSHVLDEDMAAKKVKWCTPGDCYTLCKVHRRRGEDGAYPHTYEVRLDHSDELVMVASREDEQSPCRFFASRPGGVGPASLSEHCRGYLGCIVPNFWGTTFLLHDSGSDVATLLKTVPAARGLPVRQRAQLCKIGYETNILGDVPRRVTVDFERDGEAYHMTNMAPRWDKKLNSYALPFFGRVKKASAKNFQLVVNDDPNTIYLMFGKISKDVFCLDFRGPLTALDAIAIASAALAKKRAVS